MGAFAATLEGINEAHSFQAHHTLYILLRLVERIKLGSDEQVHVELEADFLLPDLN